MLSLLAASLALAAAYLLILFGEKRIKNRNKFSQMTHIPKARVDNVPYSY